MNRWTTRRRDGRTCWPPPARCASRPTRPTRALPSAPRCWTSRAASTPAAMSRTPPTRRAVCAEASGAVGDGAGRRHARAGRGWCAAWPRPVTPCGGCRQKLREFRRRQPAHLVADLTSGCASHTLGELLPAQLRPRSPESRHDATTPSPPAAPRCAPPGQRCSRAWPCCWARAGGRLPTRCTTPSMCPTPTCRPFPRLGVGGHAGVLRAGRIGSAGGWCWPAASTPTKPAKPTA
jgi:hypothetical protein